MARSADEVTTELATWAGSVLPGVSVNAPSLRSTMRHTGIDLRLVRTSPRQAPPAPSSPLTIDLDYLLTIQLPDAAAEQHAVAELMFAAMARTDVEVLGGDEVAKACATAGLPVAPGLILRAPLLRERQPKAAVRPRRPVPAPATVANLAVVAGRVVGPDNGPVEAAVVTAFELDRSVRTDGAGRFRFAEAGADGAVVRLVARAGEVEVEGVAVAGLPITLRLPLEP